jgi:hypothetical protein
MGKLVVITNNPANQIRVTTVEKISDVKPKAYNGVGSLRSSLKAGQYTVSVQGNSNGVSESFRLKARSINRLYIPLPKTTGVEPVTFDQAQDVVANQSNMIYFNPQDGSLNDVNTQNQDNETDESSYNLKNIVWASTTYGVGQNSNGQIFILDNGYVSPLSPPTGTSYNKSTVFTVTPSHEICLSINSFVYKSSKPGVFTEIYKANSSPTALIADTNQVGIIDSGFSTSGQNVTPSLTVVNNNGSKSSIKFKSLLDDWSNWSPDGKYLFIAGSVSGEVLDSSLHVVSTVPAANISNPVWNGDVIFYNISSQLWSFNTQTGKASLVANMPLGDLINQLSVSLNGTYIYMVTVDNTGNTAIRRMSLNGQPVSPIVFQLQDTLPVSTPGAGYSIGLINFSGEPTIQIVLADGGPSNALQQVSQQLQSDGFDISKLQFSVVQGD